MTDRLRKAAQEAARRLHNEAEHYRDEGDDYQPHGAALREAGDRLVAAFSAEPEPVCSVPLCTIWATVHLCQNHWDSTLRIAAPEPGGEALRIVFDGPPSHESGRFVDVESMLDGRSVGVGEWTQDGAFWHLGPLYAAPPDTVPLSAYRELAALVNEAHTALPMAKHNEDLNRRLSATVQRLRAEGMFRAWVKPSSEVPA